MTSRHYPPDHIDIDYSDPRERGRVDGREGTILDVDEQEVTLRMVERDRVEIDRVDLLDRGDFLRGPTEPETRREEWERVCSLMLAARPDGVSEVCWRAVVADIGEATHQQRGYVGPDDAASMRRRCALVRQSFEVAERAKQWTGAR